MLFSHSTVPNGTILHSSSLLQRSTSSLLLSIPTSRNDYCARVKMSSDSLPPLPESRIILGCGGISVDFLAAVAAYPKPDDKIRSTSLKVQGGGNAGNAMTCAARLGLNPRVISKIADDSQGRSILEELENDGVDTSFLVVSKDGNSPFTYIIVDDQTKTRTCIHTPGYPSMIPDDLSQSSLLSALDGVRVVYSDARLPETALVVAREATRQNIPLFIDAERKREGLDDLLKMATYVVCSTKFPQSLTKLRANGIGTVNGRMFVGTAEKIPPPELVDTTGAGDAFIGAVLYGICYHYHCMWRNVHVYCEWSAICADMPPEKMLPFAAKVAAAGCRALGARTGLPHRTDPCLAPFLH